ncbi:MAG: hypothetical protein H6Q66_2085 [Firmicutes bacterium]|nr:hypothetical protein [Bacillota bacterium]
MSFLTLDCAKVLLERAGKKAQHEYGRPISIAICDPYGLLKAFARMEEAPIRTVQISISKAYTASRMESSTEAFLARLRKEELEISNFCDPLLTALPGGTLLKDTDGNILGAVGVSGLAPADDQCVAEYVADLFRLWEETSK